jgi:dolichyl-phosphate beta-glucosyltransferase
LWLLLIGSLFAALAGTVMSRRARLVLLRAAQSAPTWRAPSDGVVRLTVVLPAYNEATRIGPTIERLRDELGDVAENGGLQILVVDDGSTDATADVAREAGAAVVIHPQNRGKGAAVRTGVLAASGRTIAFTDADLAYAPHHLRAVLDEVERGWDIVVGSRRHPDSSTVVEASLLRAVGSRAINLLTRAVLLGHYRDTQSGLKGFRGDVARVMFAHTTVDGMGFDIEVLYLAERLGLSLHEVPVRVANSTTSSVRVVRDGLQLVGDLFAVRRRASQGAYDLTPDEAAVLV